MKAIVLLLVFSSYSLALPANDLVSLRNDADSIDRTRYLLTKNEAGDLEMVDLLSESVTYQGTRDDVTFHLYTRNNPEDSEVITKQGILDSAYFNPKKRTFFVVHGWRDSYLSKVNNLIRDAMLDAYDVNVIVVDWSPVATRNYITAMLSVKSIGEAVGDFINYLVEELSMNVKQFGIVGHSLGAHVSGNAGAAVNGQIDFIVGLDPAGPLFSYSYTENRLDPTDADYVEVIHTSLLLGFQHPSGHIDFFPNGGMRQPGCGLDLEFICAHSRSFEYYAESLKEAKFLGHKCTSYSDFEAGRCNHTNVAVMGQIRLDKKAEGNYYLQTRDEEPFYEG